jgi:hypothetical protein
MFDKTASEYLEKKQREYYKDFRDPEEIKTERYQKYSKAIEEQKKQLYGMPGMRHMIDRYGLPPLEDIDLPTVFESPVMYPILQDLSKEIEDSIRETPIYDGETRSILPKLPLIGTIPSGRVNAMAIKVPNAVEYIVAFEDQFTIFAHLVAQVIAQSLPLKVTNGGVEPIMDFKEIDNHLSNHPEAAQRLKELFFAYLFMGAPGHAPSYLLDEPFYSLTSVFRDSMELFVMGHEYSHLILNHVNGSKSEKRHKGNIEFFEICFKWVAEFSADELGMTLAMTSMKKKKYLSLVLSYAGIDLFFSIMDILEKSISIVKNCSVNVDSDTHPPILQRRETIRKMLTKIEGEKFSEVAIHSAKALEYIIMLLWEKIKPSLYEARSDRFELASKWRSCD